MTFKSRHLICFTVALMTVFSGFSASAAETFKIGSYPANPPWEFKNEAGDFQGFEVDIVTEIASRLGADVDISGLDFRALFVATASGRADAVISSLTITDERLESQSFTQPYFSGALGFGAKEDSGIESLDDLHGKKVGSIATTFSEGWLKDREDELGYASYGSYDSTANLLTDLRNGRIDVAVNEILGLRYAFTQPQLSNLKVVIEVPTGDKFAIMMPKDSENLGAFNDTLSAMKTDGTMATIYEKWFGVVPAADSLTLTPLPIPTLAN
ncbi:MULTISPECIES: ABC transporter substrate-binding protein [Pacificibacter]|uniref:ABC transporter substrate-binding protein n=1 Tax=Pacificibacter TaxID=1042323 RepID=UPI001C093075|nr:MULTISPECIES: ABC transporter substrate-binding protein [Pacificibacter]MBU2936746.1 ABC transporter substrate-binding protein [Pacificibacter marinus]MDO6617357.1 ABC transporter substrate-binding protein [Pacificibacter sp. 1_MG-2023]